MPSLPSPRRLTTLGLAAAAVLATLSLPSPATAEPLTDPDDAALASRFTLAVLPDTQFYSRYSADQFGPRYNNRDPFLAQTEWLAEHRDELNIPFVTHVGDIVDRAGNSGEWTAADRAMDVLDAEQLPYAVVAGNHDVINSSDTWYDTNYTKENERYWQTFGPGKRPAPSTLGGYDATGFSQWHVFEAQGQKFLSMSIPWRASDATLAWAKQVIETQDLPTILTSHELIGIDADAVTPKTSGAGERVWNGLIKGTDQIFLTLNGHFHGSTHLTRNNEAGRPVTQILIDHQMAYEGGNGYLGLLEFDLTNNTMTMQTGSPWVVAKQKAQLTSYDQAFLEAPNQQYQIPLDFSARFSGLDGDGGFEDGPADQPSLTTAARDILLDGFVPPAGGTNELAGSDDDYVDVPGTLAHWRFGDAEPGIVQPGQVFEDVSGDSDLRRATLAESGSATAQVGDVTVTDATNPYSSDPGAVCFTGSNQTTGRYSYLQSAAGTPVTTTAFPNGYTIETFLKMDASWDATANGWSKAVVRSGNRSKIDGFAKTQWDWTASPTALGISNLREFQMTEVPGDPTLGDKTAWSGEIMVDTWQHVALVNDPIARTTTMYVDGAPVLRNATGTAGASFNDAMPWILGADWVDDKARNGWNGCIGETRIIDHPTTPAQWLTARPTLAGFSVGREPQGVLPAGTDSTLIVGTGTPKATVTLAGDLAGTTKVDANGLWMLDAKVPAVTRALTWSASQAFGDRADATTESGTFSVAAPGTPAKTASTTAAVSTGSATYGASHDVVVRVSGTGAPTGALKLSAGGREVATGSLSGGRAVLSLPGTTLAPGRHELVVDYAGDAGHAPSYDTVTVEVAKAAADLQVAVKGRTKLVVRLAAGVSAEGELVVRDGGNQLIRTTVENGRQVLKLKRLRPGKHVLKVGFAGSATVAPATERVVVRVRR